MSGILNLTDDDPETMQLLGRNAWVPDGGLLAGFVPASADTLPRPRTLAHELGDLGWRGLQWLAPNITDPATYAPLPPPRWTPTAEGKLPSSDRDPRVEGVASDLVNIAQLAMPLPGAGAIAGAAARWLRPGLGRGMEAAESLAARRVSMYNPPDKPQRPFELDYKPADYPQGVPADATGRLTHDIDGRPIAETAYVVGRRTLGGGDEALPPAELNPLAEKVFGRRYQVEPAAALPRNAVGVYDPNTGQILVYKGLPGEIRDMVAAHEVAHGLNDKAGEFVLRRANMIPIKPGMPSELKTIYNDLNNSQLAAARARNPNVDPADVPWGTDTTPQSSGYSKADAPAELMAEAMRAYLAGPNYLKTVGPKSAAALREAVNTNPRVNRFIHLNST